jgi:hypothetical protein
VTPGEQHRWAFLCGFAAGGVYVLLVDLARRNWKRGR